MPPLPPTQVTRLQGIQTRAKEAQERLQTHLTLHDTAESEGTKNKALRLAQDESLELAEAMQELIDALLEVT